MQEKILDDGIIQTFYDHEVRESPVGIVVVSELRFGLDNAINVQTFRIC